MITISIFVGVIMLMIGKKLPSINRLCTEASDLVDSMMAVIGYFLPALNCYCLQLKILLAANKLGIVDHSILEKASVSEA